MRNVWFHSMKSFPDLDKINFSIMQIGCDAGAHRNNNQTMKNMKEWKIPNGKQRSREVKGILNDANHINYDVLAPMMV